MGESYRKAFSFDLQNHDVEAFATIYATRVGERAYLYSEKGHGYFTWALLNGLAGAAANAAGDVTLGNLERYVQDTVPRQVHLDLGPTVDQRPFAEVGGFRAEELVLARVTIKGPVDAAANDARAKELAQWDKIASSRDVKAFAEFRQKYPGSGLAQEATRRMEQLNWDSVKSTSDPKVLQEFLSDYPNGAYAQQANTALEALRQTLADRQGVIDALTRYSDVFARKDLDQIRVLWPTLSSKDARKFQDFFGMARSIRLNFQPGTPEIAADKATVVCVRVLQFADERGLQPPVQDRVTIRLHRVAESWAIDSLQ